MFKFGKEKKKEETSSPLPAGFVKVAKTGQIKPGQLVEATAGKVALALTNVDGQYYAFAAHCPHQGWPLWSGNMQGELVRCYLHRWQFNVRTGENVAPGGVPVCLPTYPVQVQGNEIWVDVSKTASPK
jgi:nitrite reductase/ring-hydroxylating ferredoxin subunit